MTAFVTFTSSTVVAWLALLSPLLVLAAVACAFTVPEVLRRRRVRRRMDGLFSPVRVASSGDAAGDGEIRPLVPCGSFADGGRGACPPLPTRPPVSVFSVPASVVAVELSVPRAGRARTAHGPGHPYEHVRLDPRLVPHLEPTCSSPMVQETRLAWLGVWVVAFLALMALVAGCNPQDDSGTDGVVEPTSEAETDSGSQP